jgi:hypothetical protein
MTVSRSPRSAVAPLLVYALCAVLLPATLTGQSPSGGPASSPPAALMTDAEREVFLAKARIVRTQPAPKGVTRTLRVTLSDGSITHDASIQTIDERRMVFETPQGTELNFKDSWRFNVAAYRIDRLLKIGMIPTTVSRRHGTMEASFTWWIDEVLMDEQERYRQKHSAPDSDDWNQQMWITRLFDQLIANVDRNLGNLIIDRRWNIWMIDHSRAFRMNSTLRSPGNLSKVDRDLLERIRQMDKESVRGAVGHHLTGDEIDALLKRRDRIVEHFQARGTAAIFDRKARCC